MPSATEVLQLHGTQSPAGKGGLSWPQWPSSSSSAELVESLLYRKGKTCEGPVLFPDYRSVMHSQRKPMPSPGTLVLSRPLLPALLPDSRAGWDGK